MEKESLRVGHNTESRTALAELKLKLAPGEDKLWQISSG